MRGAARRNDFDALRLAAALAVVIGHAWPLTGLHPPPTVLGFPVYTLAVYVFFAISGHLVASSWRRDPHPGRFLARRALRILPALVVVVVLTALVVGPLVTTLDARAYFASPSTWAYLTNVTLVAGYDLPGVFADNPVSAVNGVLWTLGPEFLCYLAVLAIGSLPRRARIPVALAATAALVVLSFASPWPDWTPAFRAAVFFAGGAALAVLRRFRLPLVAGALVLIAWGGVALSVPELALPAAWLALPPLVIAAGRASTPGLRTVGVVGDLSYGSYLWGFLVQQVVVQLAPGLPLGADVAIVVVATLAIAAASWHLVERRALALKPSGPSRARAGAGGESAHAGAAG